MNSLERVLATVSGNPTDRRAVSLLLSLYGARLTGCPLESYYRDPTAYAQGQAAVQETFQPDILFGPFALPLEGAAFGSQVRFFETQAPNLARPVLSNPEEIKDLSIPNLESDPYLAYFHEAVRLLAAQHGSDTPIAAIAIGPVDLPIMLLGIEGWLEAVLFDDSSTKRILDITIPYTIQRFNDLFDAGATFIVTPAVFANPSIVTKSIIKRLALPALCETFSQVNGPIVIHSGGARLTPFLDIYSQLSNVAGFLLNANEDMKLARQITGENAVLIGNLDGPNLHHLSEDTIQADCEQLLKDCKTDPRIILGTCGADIAYETPTENILALRSAALSVSKGLHP
jgi:uroporphyrinogen decarboxylase